MLSDYGRGRGGQDQCGKYSQPEGIQSNAKMSSGAARPCVVEHQQRWPVYRLLSLGSMALLGQTQAEIPKAMSGLMVGTTVTWAHKKASHSSISR